jgi:hypothetical protein
MNIYRTLILAAICTISNGAELSPSDTLISSSDKIYVVVIEELIGFSGPMGVANYHLTGKIAAALKGNDKIDQVLSVKWKFPCLGPATPEQTRRKVKDGERFIVFLKLDPDVKNQPDHPKYILADPWLGFQPYNLSFEGYIQEKISAKPDK